MKFILHSSLKNIYKEVLVGLAWAFVVLPGDLRFEPSYYLSHVYAFKEEIIGVQDDEIPNFKNLSI